MVLDPDGKEEREDRREIITETQPETSILLKRELVFQDLLPQQEM